MTTIVDKSGKIKCIGCNQYECISSEKNFIVRGPVPPSFPAGIHNGSQIITAESKNISLSCPGSGTPIPTIFWYKDDNPLNYDDPAIRLDGNNRSLIIHHLIRNYSGKYTCIVKNQYGGIQRYQFVVVEDTYDRTWLEGPSMWMISSALLTFLIVGSFIYFCVKSKGRAMMKLAMKQQLKNDLLVNFEKGDLNCVKPDLMVTDQVDLLPYDKKWEFPRDRLKLGKVLGSGAFGVVRKSEALGIMGHEAATTVAVKMVHQNAEPADTRALAAELKILVFLGKHLNIVNLLGACTKNIDRHELLVIVEYCALGNLRDYLLSHRTSFIDQLDPETGRLNLEDRTGLPNAKLIIAGGSVDSNQTIVNNAKCEGVHGVSDFPCVSKEHTTPCQGTCSHTNSENPDPILRTNASSHHQKMSVKSICTQDLLSWAFQVARGMEYLAQKKVLHGDLAARNILLTKSNVVKICDFGLAKTMYKYNNYIKKSDGPLPIKWLAIESIRDNIFSTQSDVWSFGVTLWEFFAIGRAPYPTIRVRELLQELDRGYRMEQPKYAPDDVYKIMLRCWRSEPGLRPSFTQLVDSIGELIEKSVRTHYIELNEPYIIMNGTGQKGKEDYSSEMSGNLSSLPDTFECINSAYLSTDY